MTLISLISFVRIIAYCIFSFYMYMFFVVNFKNKSQIKWIYKFNFKNKSQIKRIYKFSIFEFILGTKFYLKYTILIFCPILPKKSVFLPEQKNEYHHWIQHIRVNLDANFYLKQTILIILTWIPNFFRYHKIHLLKRYFQSISPTKNN